MEIKSCKTCEFQWDVHCCETACSDCPIADATNYYRCKCRDVTDFENCPYYKKYEPTPADTEISSSH